ncbi:MAG: histidine kinase [Bacteroidota bacterium]
MSYLRIAVISLIFLLGFSIYFYIQGPPQEQSSEIAPVFYLATTWILSVILLLWIGNYGIYLLFDRLLPWASNMAKRLYLQLLISGIYTLMIVNATYYIFKSAFTLLPPDIYQLVLLNIYGVLFLLPVFSIFFGIYFMLKWKKVTIEKNTLEKENMLSELKALKSHIDPHFLFNNLNILSSLIEPYNEAALDFLDNFSEVYRYVLKNKDTEAVSLNTELDFMEAYLHILEKRFENQLIIKSNVDIRLRNKMIPPMALQLLVENTIKHNKLSFRTPLCVELFNEGETYLVVKNNIQRKTQKPGNPGDTGLYNLKKRLSYVTNKELKVSDNGAYFTVSIPLLSLDKS